MSALKYVTVWNPAYRGHAHIVVEEVGSGEEPPRRGVEVRRGDKSGIVRRFGTGR